MGFRPVLLAACAALLIVQSLGSYRGLEELSARDGGRVINEPGSTRGNAEKPTCPQFSWASCPKLATSLVSPFLFNANSLAKNLRWEMPYQIACGPNEKQPCPVLACGFAFAAATSAPRGCAWAASLVTSAGFGTNAFQAITEYMESEIYFCGDEETTRAQRKESVERLATAVASATALALVDAVQFVCFDPASWPSCKTCSTCGVKKRQDAISIVQGRASGVAQALASAFATAWIRAYSGHHLAAEASSVAMSMSNAINTAVAAVYKKISAAKQNCQTISTSDCQKAVASAVACTFAKALVLASEDTASEKPNIMAAQCTDSQALADSTNRPLSELIDMCSERNNNNCGKCAAGTIPLVNGTSVACHRYGPLSCKDADDFTKNCYKTFRKLPDPPVNELEKTNYEVSDFGSSGLAFDPPAVAVKTSDQPDAWICGHSREIVYQLCTSGDEQLIYVPQGTTAFVLYLQSAADVKTNVTAYSDCTNLDVGSAGARNATQLVEMEKCTTKAVRFAYAGPGYFTTLRIPCNGGLIALGDIETSVEVPPFPCEAALKCASTPHDEKCS